MSSYSKIPDRENYENQRVIKEIILNAPPGAVKFAVELDGVTYHVLHVNHVKGSRGPLTISVVIPAPENEPLMICSFQEGWLGAEEVMADIIKGRKLLS